MKKMPCLKNHFSWGLQAQNILFMFHSSNMISEFFFQLGINSDNRPRGMSFFCMMIIIAKKERNYYIGAISRAFLMKPFMNRAHSISQDQ